MLAVDLTTGTLLPPLQVRAPGFVDGFTFAPRQDCLRSECERADQPRPRHHVAHADQYRYEHRGPGDRGSERHVPARRCYHAFDGQTAHVSGSVGLEPVSLTTGGVLKPIGIAGSIENFEVAPTGKVGYAWQPAHADQLVDLASGSRSEGKTGSCRRPPRSSAPADLSCTCPPVRMSRPDGQLSSRSESLPSMSAGQYCSQGLPLGWQSSRSGWCLPGQAGVPPRPAPPRNRETPAITSGSASIARP